jgi:hypothetical protein
MQWCGSNMWMWLKTRITGAAKLRECGHAVEHRRGQNATFTYQNATFTYYVMI